MTTAGSDMADKACVPCEGGDVEALDEETARRHLEALDDWELDGGKITRLFTFKNYHQTIAFTNAVAWIAHQENHHPDLEVKYRTCRVSYVTHAIGGLSENDFICAAKVNRLIGG